MKDHGGDARAFNHLKEAWYAESAIGRDECVDEVMLGFYSPDGGTSGEFAVRWQKLGGKLVPQLQAWDDSWSALIRFFDVLIHLADKDNENITPEEFCEILKSCGVEDQTPRERG